MRSDPPVREDGRPGLYWRPGVITYPLCQDCGARLTGQPRIIVGRWYCCQSCALRRQKAKL